MTDGVTRPERSVQVERALRERWWLVVLTPVVTVALAVVFLLWVRPVFESTTTLRFVDDQSPFGGASAPGLESGGSGLSVLASLTGRSIPIQSEMSVLRSRDLARGVVRDLGLRVFLDEPDGVAWGDVFQTTSVGDGAAEGEYTLSAGDGGFTVVGDILVDRDPFKPFLNERRERRELGRVSVGGRLPIDGTNITLSSSADRFDEITFTIMSNVEAVDIFQERVTVGKPDREADVVEVVSEWWDPVMAARIAEHLTDRFIARREALQAEQYGTAAGFLSGQLDSLSSELRGAEDDLRSYREAQGIVEPEAQATSAIEQLAGLQGRRDLLVAERRSLARLLREVQAEEAAGNSAEPPGESPYRRLVFFPTLLQNAATAELLRLLGELENERASLYGRRTVEAREVQVLTQRISELEGQLRTVAETYLQGLGNQVDELADLLSGFAVQLSRVPATELEYLRRRRQVEVLTQLYVFMEMRQKEAEVTAAGEAGGVRILDRPMVAIEATRPRPALTVGLALVVGLLLGLAGAVVLDHTGSPRTDP